MRLYEALALATRTRRAFFRESKPHRIYRCLDGNPDKIYTANIDSWEWLRQHPEHLFAGDSPERWHELFQGWFADDVLAADWKFEAEERLEVLHASTD